MRIHYSSRAATFTAGPNISRQRRLTGIEGPSAIATHGLSFRQPSDVDDEEEDDDDDNSSAEHLDVDDPTPQELQAQSTAQEIERLADHHVTSDGTPPEASTATPPAIKPPRPSTIDRHSSEGPDSHPTSQQPRSDGGQNSNEDNIKPLVPQPDTENSADPSADESPQRTQRAIAKSRASHKQSSSSESETPVWLSAPASRASSNPSPVLRSRTRLKESRSESPPSFSSANEVAPPSPSRLESVPELDSGSGGSSINDHDLEQRQSSQTGLSTIRGVLSRTSSHTSLIHHYQSNEPQVDGPADETAPEPSKAIQHMHHRHSRDREPTSSETGRPGGRNSGLVRFEIPTSEEEEQRMMKLRLAQMRKRDTFKRIRRGKVNDGEIIKMENMLVRLESTVHKIPDDFTENDSEKIETSVVERWKEFMCVCRETEDDHCPFVLQFYQTRVIPAIEKTQVRKRWTREIQLRKSNCRMNLYSSLDKTIAIWHPHRHGNLVYTMQSRSGANSMEWFTFLRNVLGWSRPSVLQVSIPDLSRNLRLDNPFEKLESSRDLVQAVQGDEQAMLRTMKEEQAVAAHIIRRCMDMLSESPELATVMKEWQGAHKMGLAWKRYDRLEWVHGANEKKMYGTIGMEKSHELELRPKQHYPTIATDKKRQTLVEPTPVEGFLIRLTSQKGADQKLGKLFFKRLYFSTHSQFLVFNRPARADPPPPPRLPMTQDAHIPSAEEIAEKTPLIYAVTPYALKDGQIEWLAQNNGTASDANPATHDHDAFDENHRRLGLLRNCDGLINLCDVVRVRRVLRGATPADGHIDSGSDVDFAQPVPDTTRDDGTTKDMDDSRIFELVLRNGLVVRLQAYNAVTKKEWMTRLRDLAKYWTLRTAADISLYKSVRAENLELLNIDEPIEALVGQYAQKWEVARSAASPELYNLCGIACCRSVHMSGHLFHKSRQYGAFNRMLCILSHGKLLMFADALRGRDGKVLKQIHHERIGTMDLRECYVYSGIATARDLLYQGGTSTFDRAKPGRHGLPRIWLDDGWSSSDEDTSTCFVIWHGKKSGWFRSQDDAAAVDSQQMERAAGAGHRSSGNAGAATQRGKGRLRLRRVRKLGTEGKGMVFRARSRAEKDHWVLSIGMEIERLLQEDQVRVVGKRVK